MKNHHKKGSTGLTMTWTVGEQNLRIVEKVFGSNFEISAPRGNYKF